MKTRISIVVRTAVVSLGLALLPGISVHAQHGAAGVSPSAALKSSDQTLALIREASLALLKEGNSRYVAGKPRHANQDADRRSITVSEGQKPFATILACSDSRSPVEVIFDRGIGELFVVRVAGNVADDTQLGTIEYGVAHLGTSLLVVLGHTGCGAVSAACKGGDLQGHLPSLVSRIQPAVARARAAGTHPDRLLAAAVQANVWQQIEQVIFRSSVTRDYLRSGSLEIVGGVYDLEKGTINWLGSHPTESELISKADALDKAATHAGSSSQSPGPHGRSGAEVARENDPHPAGGGHEGQQEAESQRPTTPGFPAAILPSREVSARAKQIPRSTPQGDDHH